MSEKSIPDLKKLIEELLSDGDTSLNGFGARFIDYDPP
jgi:hypothetical protein